MRIKEQLVSSRAKTYGDGNQALFVTVHETANRNRGAGAQAHANLQSRGNVRNASWHWQVDDREAIRSYPDSAQCWHAGDGRGPGNLDSIAIEICVNSDGNYDAALGNAAEVVKQLREAHGIAASGVLQHHDHSGKDCPRDLRASGRWAAFVRWTEPGTEAGRPTPPASGGGRSVSAMATEVINGQHGNGHATRRASLRVDDATYQQVRAEVNRRLAPGSTSGSGSTSGRSVSAMATEVIRGAHGNGHANRRRSLGISAAEYARVRAEVNRRLS